MPSSEVTKETLVSKVLDAICRRSEVGKLTQSALYFHRSAFLLTPVEVKLAVLGAEERFLTDAFYKTSNILKIMYDKSAVSFLWYPDFDRDPHPALSYSLHVPLDPSRLLSRRDYRNNPPILHRKEEFVTPDYPKFRTFQRLTKTEEAVGLLKNTPGRRNQWQNRLKQFGYELKGHKLVKR